MRLVFPHNGSPEAAAWYELPDRLREQLDRSQFLFDLRGRQERFLEECRLILEQKGIYGDCKVIASGDWHSGQCVFVVEGQDKGRVALKPRCNQVTLMIEEICRRSGFSDRYGVLIPSIEKAGNFWVQDYIQRSESTTTTPSSLASLAALILWGGLTDLHDENLIFTNGAIYLIDTECAFEFSEAWTPLRQLDDSGLITGRRPGLSQVKRKNFKIEQSIENVAASALTLLINEAGQDIYERVDAVRLRRVLLNTRIYMTFLRKRFVFGWSEEETIHKWQDLRSAKPERASIVEYEQSTLCNWSVPIFYKYGSGLLDGDGRRVDDCEPASSAMRVAHDSLKDLTRVRAVVATLENFVRG